MMEKWIILKICVVLWQCLSWAVSFSSSAMEPIISLCNGLPCPWVPAWLRCSVSAQLTGSFCARCACASLFHQAADPLPLPTLFHFFLMKFQNRFECYHIKPGSFLSVFFLMHLLIFPCYPLPSFSVPGGFIEHDKHTQDSVLLPASTHI